jgi:hypothetical protein
MRQFCLMVLYLSLASGVLSAQDAGTATCLSVSGGEQAGMRQLLGLQSCRNCHEGAQPNKDSRLARQFALKGDAGWIRGDELSIWGGEDRHSQAYATLLGEASKRIGRALGREESIHRDVRCLACHTAYPILQLSIVDSLIDADLVKTDNRLIQGVSCEGCHGAAGDGGQSVAGAALKGWLGPHHNSDTWRYLSAEEKCRSGYLDVRSVVSRTRICASCHVGDKSMGRILTHEMYAAGHPPLPPFELETFEDLMPRHWMDFSEKGADLREKFQQRAAVKMADAELSRSRTTVVSALVVYAAFLRLTSELADPAGDLEIPGGQRPAWPEFSQFDCYACHHDLKSSNWRQTAQAVGRPGRPRLVPWPAALARAVAATSSNAADFAGLEQRLNDSVVATPFGDSMAVTVAARDLAAACDALAISIESSGWTDESQRLMLDAILAAGGGLATPVADYDSARQYAWAFAVLQAESEGKKRADVITDWFGSEAGLSTRSGVPLLLDLKVGEQTQTLLPGAEETLSILQIDPARVLPPIAGYDAVQFQAAFREIHQKLRGPAGPK